MHDNVTQACRFRCALNGCLTPSQKTFVHAHYTIRYFSEPYSCGLPGPVASSGVLITKSSRDVHTDSPLRRANGRVNGAYRPISTYNISLTSET